MSQSGSNIRTLFTSAKKLTQDLDSLASSSQQYQDNLRTAISTFEECRKLADGVSLWSPNETEDDISSGELAYLSIDYYLGNLLSNAVKSNRKGQVLSTREAYERFLTLLDRYAILSKGDQKLWERYQDDKDAFTLLPSSDASSRRESKITRFKEGKALEKKIEVGRRSGHDLRRREKTKNLTPDCSTTKTYHRPGNKTTQPSAPFITQKSNSTPTAPSRLSI